MLRIIAAAVLFLLPSLATAEPERATGTTSPAVVHLMPAAKAARLRNQLPQVDNEVIQSLLEDPSLILYSSAEMPAAYQDWSSSLPGVHSPHYNVSANQQEPFGNGNLEFPWGTPGGTHRTTSVSTFRFLWLPTEGGQRLPVVWFRQRLPGSSQEGYAWIFPVGTVVGEVLRLRAPDGTDLVFEVRVRLREYGEWAVDVFRPFPTANDLVDRIRQLRPQWRDHDQLATLLQHLEQPVELTRHTLTDRHPTAVAFRQSMGVDVLPEIGDPELVETLLTETVFRSALGETWRDGSNGVASAAPTTLADFHIVPANYDAGFIVVDRMSCMNCHETVNRHVNSFEFGRDWYGRIRGSDGIFSLHPFDPASISRNGASVPVRMNPLLRNAGIFEQFDPQEHDDQTYQQLLNSEELMPRAGARRQFAGEIRRVAGSTAADTERRPRRGRRQKGRRSR